MNKHRIIMFLLLLGDAAIFYAALFGWLSFRYTGNEEGALLIKRHIIPFSIIFASWILFFGAAGLYNLRIMQNSKTFLYRLLRTMVMNVILAVLILYIFLPSFAIEPRRNLFAIALAATFFVFIWRFLFNLFIVRTPSSRVLFFGITKEAVELVDFLLLHPQLGQKPVAFLSLNGETDDTALPLPYIPSTPPIPHLANANQIAHIVRDFGVDTIVILRELKENKALVKLLFDVIPLGIAVVEFPKFYEALTGKIPLSLIAEVWFLENLVGIKKNFYEFFKRILDIAVAICAAIPAIVLFPMVALTIKLDSKGPIFYRQERVGRNKKIFSVIKYRTMMKDADKMSGFKGEGGDPRHTRVGRILRKSYLDELPQIIHILKGEMSFVGPRPERPQYVTGLTQKIPFYEMRLLTPPGITGWAQINMGNDASVEDAPEKMQYDLYYIKNRSFALDLLVILRTIFILLRREGR